MFWKILKWGSTIIVILIVLLGLLATFSSQQSQPDPRPNYHTTDKKFNL